MLYEERKYSAAVKHYHQAIAIDPTSASFFSNLGAALFSKKEFDPAVIAYEHAMQSDPEVFGAHFARLSACAGTNCYQPQCDRAYYDYTAWPNSMPRWAFSDHDRWSI